MRYAPTLVRLNSLLDWVVRWFRFRPCGGRMRYAPTFCGLIHRAGGGFPAGFLLFLRGVFFFLFEGGLAGGLLFELDSDVVDEFVDVIDEGFVRGGVVGDGHVAVDEGGPCFVGAVGGAASLFQGAFFGESPFAAADYGHGEYGIVVDADVAEHFLEAQVVECLEVFFAGELVNDVGEDGGAPVNHDARLEVVFVEHFLDLPGRWPLRGIGGLGPVVDDGLEVDVAFAACIVGGGYLGRIIRGQGDLEVLVFSGKRVLQGGCGLCDFRFVEVLLMR